MAGGAREALAAHGMTIRSSWLAATRRRMLLTAIEEGTQAATFVYPPQSGKAGMLEGLKYLRGSLFG